MLKVQFIPSQANPFGEHGSPIQFLMILYQALIIIIMALTDTMINSEESINKLFQFLKSV